MPQFPSSAQVAQQHFRGSGCIQGVLDTLRTLSRRGREGGEEEPSPLPLCSRRHQPYGGKPNGSPKSESAFLLCSLGRLQKASLDS